LVILLI
jgi:flap endonuclease-1